MTIYNDEAVKTTANRLGIKEECLRDAIRHAAEYERDLRRIKDRRKLEREQRLMESELADRKAKHPEWCWCDNPRHDPTRDEMIRQEKTWCPYYVSADCLMDSPVYRCPDCGGEYRITLVWA